MLQNNKVRCPTLMTTTVALVGDWSFLFQDGIYVHEGYANLSISKSTFIVFIITS